MTPTHFGTVFATEEEAKDNCPKYCIVEYCEECKGFHVVQK